MKLLRENFILFSVYLVTVVLWIIFIVYTRNSALTEGPYFNYVLVPFLLGETLIPFVGGIIGLQRAKSWGGTQSVMGRGMIALALGLFGWTLGMVVWNYYLFVSAVEVPYPSLGDLFYISIWPLWTYAMIELSRVTGARFGLRKKGGRTLLILISLLVVSISYYLLFVVARGGIFEWNNAIELLLGVAYPLGDVLILLSSISVFIFSFKFLGGRYHKPVLLLIFGFVLNYVADFFFVYSISIGTYFNGHISDFLYVNMLFVVALGVSMLDTHKSSSV